MFKTLFTFLVLFLPSLLIADISKVSIDREQRKVKFTSEAKVEEQDGPSWKPAEQRAWEAGVQGIIAKATEIFQKEQPDAKLKEPRDLARDAAPAVSSRKTTYVKGGIVRITFDAPVEAFVQ